MCAACSGLVFRKSAITPHISENSVSPIIDEAGSTGFGR